MHLHDHDPPPDAPPPSVRATEGGAGTRLGSRVDSPQDTPRRYRQSPTLAFLEGRERVLGRRLSLHRDPTFAAALLVEELGSKGARHWLLRALEEVGR